MKMWFSRFLADTTPQGRNAFRVVVIVLLASLFSLPMYVYIGAQTGDWQIYAIAAMVLVLCGTAALSGSLARRNRVSLAIGIILGSVSLIIPFITALISGLGLILGVTLFLVGVMIAGQTLSGKEATRGILTSVVFAVITLLVDLFAPWERLFVPQLQVAIPYIAGVAILALGIFVVRQFSSYSLRTKLLVSVVSVSMISIVILASVNYYNSRANLVSNAGAALKSVAESEAAAIRNVIIQETHILQSFNLSKLVQDRVDEANTAYGPDQASNLQQIEALDEQWKKADQANNEKDPLVEGALNSEVASELREFRDAFPENAEVFVTDKYGALLAATNRTSDYYQADEDWWQAAYNNGTGALYFGQPEFDESSQTFGIILALPIFSHGTNEVAGVVRTTLNIDAILAILDAEFFGGSGEADLYLPGDQVLDPEFAESLSDGDPEALARLNALLTDTTFESFTYEGKPGIVSAAQVTTTDGEAQAAIQNLSWVVVMHQDENALLAPIREQTRITMLIALVILGISASASIFLSQILTAPIVRLTSVARQVTAGDIAVQAQVETGDEIGTLASSFNSMTAQLREFIGTLEQRVEDRTKALETSTEVSRRLSTILDQQQLVTEVVEQVQAAFNYYHAQIYLLDKSSEELVMASGTGEAGHIMLAHGHKISKGKGLVGRAAETNEVVLVSDTSTDTDWLPNPLLPETKSEIAIPIALGDQVLGVLDVQHNQAGGLRQEDAQLLQAIANQAAVAVQNARSYTEAQTRAEREALIASIGQKIQGATTVETVLQIMARELGRAIGSKQTRVILKDFSLSASVDK